MEIKKISKLNSNLTLSGLTCLFSMLFAYLLVKCFSDLSPYRHTWHLVSPAAHQPQDRCLPRRHCVVILAAHDSHFVPSCLLVCFDTSDPDLFLIWRSNRIFSLFKLSHFLVSGKLASLALFGPTLCLL